MHYRYKNEFLYQRTPYNMIIYPVGLQGYILCRHRAAVYRF